MTPQPIFDLWNDLAKANKLLKKAQQDIRDNKALTYFGDRKRSSYRPNR